MSSKYIFLSLIFIVISIGAITILFNPFNSSSKNSFLDDLQANIFGKSGSQQGGKHANTSLVDFRINLKESEIFKYSEILFDKDCENVLLNSSYIVAGKEYENSTECYVIQYYKDQIERFNKRCKKNIFTNKTICYCNITTTYNNGTIFLCSGKIKDMFYSEEPFFGIINENFTAISERLVHYEYRYGLYGGKGNVTLKTEMKVVGKENINERNVYIINLTSENLNLEGKTPKIEINTISQIFVDADKGVVVKRTDYNGGDKIREIQLKNKG